MNIFEIQALILWYMHRTLLLTVNDITFEDFDTRYGGVNKTSLLSSMYYNGLIHGDELSIKASKKFGMSIPAFNLVQVATDGDMNMNDIEAVTEITKALKKYSMSKLSSS